MHHIHHTEGIILSSKNFGEAGKYYHIFTRDLGMIIASASGVRKMSSKLRYILTDYSYVKVDLVRGKDFWRITSASKTNLLEDLPKNHKTFGVLANISRLLKRLLPGEEENEELFSDLLSGLQILEKKDDKEHLANVEAVLVLRVLNHLGYIGNEQKLENITRSPFEEDLVFTVGESRQKILREINKALRETHL